MPRRREIKISCIGTDFIEPILDIYLKLRSFRFTGYSRTQVSPRENGYSTSIITLLVLLVESVLNRIRYFERDERDNLTFFNSKFNNPDLLEMLYEIYVIRDTIVHNHIWRISYEYDSNFNETNIYQMLLKGYGDKRPSTRYCRHVNKRKKSTKKLKLNIVPIKIDTKDVIKVFKVVKNLFEFLETENYSSFTYSRHFRYKRRNLTFYEIIDDIINEHSV